MDETVGRETFPLHPVSISKVTIDRVGEQVVHATVHFDLPAGPTGIPGPRVVTDRFEARIAVAGARNLNEVERRARRCIARFANQVVATMGAANAKSGISAKPKLGQISMGAPDSLNASATFLFVPGLPWETAGETTGEGSMDSVTFWDDMTVEIPREGGLQDLGTGAQEGLRAYMESLAAAV